ncbi:MAG: hypothetical protein K0Q91_144 [Fibrobacteria bacterium]|jgi:hypothetical protein|nr:hypothetical protein [Fibrobacteria bacterium]
MTGEGSVPSTLERLQRWYSSQCDEDWEHSYGITLQTLDNPGWWLQVDLRDTSLEGRPFVKTERGLDSLTDGDAGADWISCKVEDEKFQGTGGPGNLEEILSLFLEWAESHPDE